MNETFDVYGHRDKAGYCFVSFEDGLDYENLNSGEVERVETEMFASFRNDFWGPFVPEIANDEVDVRDDKYGLTIEEDREKLYKVGEVEVEDREVVSIEANDEVEVMER